MVASKVGSVPCPSSGMATPKLILHHAVASCMLKFLSPLQGRWSCQTCAGRRWTLFAHNFLIYKSLTSQVKKAQQAFHLEQAVSRGSQTSCIDSCQHTCLWGIICFIKPDCQISTAEGKGRKNRFWMKMNKTSYHWSSAISKHEHLGQKPEITSEWQEREPLL